MMFFQQVNIVTEFQTHSRNIVFEALKIILAYHNSPLFQSLQNVQFLVSVALMQMSCCPLTNELSEGTTAWRTSDCYGLWTPSARRGNVWGPTQRMFCCTPSVGTLVTLLRLRRT